MNVPVAAYVYLGSRAAAFSPDIRALVAESSISRYAGLENIFPSEHLRETLTPFLATESRYIPLSMVTWPLLDIALRLLI
jgi:hypothetical protein